VTYGDIKFKFGTIFLFKLDIIHDRILKYMIINPDGHLRYHSAIVCIDNGSIWGFSENDKITDNEVTVLFTQGK